MVTHAPTAQEENRGLILGLSGVTIFALTLPATRLVIEDFDPLFIGMGRAVVAACFALIILLITRPALPAPGQLKRLALTSAGIVIGFPVFSAIAMQTVDASHGGIVLALLPLATALAALLVAHEKPSRGFWIAGISGSLLVTLFALIQGRGSFQAGDFALFAAILCAAFGYAIGGTLSREMPGWQVICWSLIISLPFIVLPAWFYAPVAPISIGATGWLGFLYLALFSQLIGFFLWNKGLALGGIARVSQTQLLQPFITLLVSALLLGESIEWLSIVFCLLVVINVAIGKRMPVQQTTNH